MQLTIWDRLLVEDQLNTEPQATPTETLASALSLAKQALEEDQSCLSEALYQVLETVSSYAWITEGRGSYEYDDKRYQDEVEYAFEDIRKIARDALEYSGPRAALAAREAAAALVKARRYRP